MNRMLLVLLAVGLSAAGCSGNKAGTVADVVAKEYAFEPGTMTVAAGTIDFKVKNIGKEGHEFEIFSGDTLVDEVEDISPGLTRTLTATLQPGTYTYVCKEAGHEEKGMKGTLTVT